MIQAPCEEEACGYGEYVREHDEHQYDLRKGGKVYADARWYEGEYCGYEAARYHRDDDEGGVHERAIVAGSDEKGDVAGDQEQHERGDDYRNGSDRDGLDIKNRAQEHEEEYAHEEGNVVEIGRTHV